MVSGRFQNGTYVPYTYEDTIRQRHKVPRKDPRVRKQIKFWVDTDTPAGQWLLGAMEHLKADRLFKQTMMDGAKLISELREKKIDFLFEVAPWLESWMDAEIEREVSRRVALEVKQQSAGQGDLAARLAALEAKLAAIDAPAPTLQPVAPRPLAADDALDDVAVPMKKAASEGKAASNFLDSALSLQG